MSGLPNNCSASSQEHHSDEGITECSEEDEENTMKNPFTIPPDIDIFSIRDKEREKAKVERERMKTMKIHRKMTYSMKMKAKQKGCRKALQKEEEEEARKQATDEERLKMLQDSPSWKTANKNDYPLEKKSFCDYINALREIFLLEYAMAVKRDEIQRLEDIEKNEERKLEQAESYLKEEAAAFEEFLKENQKKSVQALKIARKETAAKTKKIREIQAINSEIEHLQSDISRLKNTLREYKMYRDFLYQLSPKEWQEKHGKKHTKKTYLKTASKANEESASPSTSAGQRQGLSSRTKSAGPSSTSCIDGPSSLMSSERSETFRLLHEIRPQLKTLPSKISLLENEESESCSDEEEPKLYFTDPQQLLTIFKEKEEEILSLIQNFQETEESVDKVITTKESMDKNLAELKQQVDTLNCAIAREEEKLADVNLKSYHSCSGEYEADDQELKSLEKKVQEVYHHCTGDDGTNLDTVQMLMVIEKRIQDILDNLDRIPPAKREQLIKAVEKGWRKRLREEKLRQQKQQEEERLRKILEKSQATTKKISGKLMFCSHSPARKEKKKHGQEQMDKEKEEELYYFT